MEVAEIKQRTEPIFRKHGFRKVGVFGSHARGDARMDSDIDLLYSSTMHTFSLFEKQRIKEELEQSLGVLVDLVPDTRVIARMRPLIKRDLKIIYEG